MIFAWKKVHVIKWLFGLFKQFSSIKCLFFCTLSLVLNMIFTLTLKVYTVILIVRMREMPIISADIFDFTARKFFRREVLSIFIDHMIIY